MFKNNSSICCSIFSASAAFSVDYSGKTVTIWVPFKAGGGTDAVARALTGPLSANLPGNPSVVVKNVTEGGGIGSVNTYVAKHGKDKDGLVVLATSGSTQLPFYLKIKELDTTTKVCSCTWCRYWRSSVCEKRSWCKRHH